MPFREDRWLRLRLYTSILRRCTTTLDRCRPTGIIVKGEDTTFVVERLGFVQNR
jgi:hypothetical protein